MNIEEILNNIGELYSPLSIECQQELIKNVKKVTFNKGAVLVREGQFSDKVYLIIKGCSRAYYLKDGKDITDWFAFENEFISSIASFFGNQPSPHYLELVEDSIVLEISRETIDVLLDAYHDFERLMRIVVTKTMLRQQERMSSILFHKAEVRYQLLIDLRPDITNRIPLTHIASYLGITLETLSRVRSIKK